jgi:voltage-gated potassium channel
MYYAEGAAQPEKLASIPHAMYWSAITLTTVGYGDVSPVTPIGQVISVFTALLGVSTVAMLTGIVASSFANQVARRRVVYEAELREALKDGRISKAEEVELARLSERFDFTEQQLADMRAEVEEEIAPRKQDR